MAQYPIDWPVLLGSVRTATGSADTRLILIRGNSASGRSTVAAGIRERYGRGIAIVGQDNLRRTVLRERGIPGGANIGLINQTAPYSAEMRDWYRDLDLLPSAAEHVITAELSLNETVHRIMADAGFACRRCE